MIDTHGLVSSAAASGRGGAAGDGGRGGGRGRGAPPGKTAAAAALSTTRGSEAVEALLQVARPSPAQLSVLIKEVGHERGAGGAEKLRWLWAWAKKQPPGLLNVFHYNACITQLGRREHLEDAFKVFGGMQAAGVQPDVVTYSAPVGYDFHADAFPAGDGGGV